LSAIAPALFELLVRRVKNGLVSSRKVVSIIDGLSIQNAVGLLVI
jgi:hypothetical protein